jgi:Fe-S-cluster formation regulator IscX/YfhJ
LAERFRWQDSDSIADAALQNAVDVDPKSSVT